MKNSFFSRFTPKEPKFFPLLKQLSEVLSASSVALVESLQHDQPTERSEYYKKIKDLEREGDRLTHLIFDELGTTFITPFDREDIHDLASCMDDVIDGINRCAKRIYIYNTRPISESGKEQSRLSKKKLYIFVKLWMNSKHSAKSRHSSENIAPNCMKSKTKRMMYMSSSSPNSLKKKKIVSNLSRLKKSCTNWKRQPMLQSM